MNGRAYECGSCKHPINGPDHYADNDGKLWCRKFLPSTRCPMCCQALCRCAKVFRPMGTQPPTYPQDCVACHKPLNAGEVARNKMGAFDERAMCDLCLRGE